MPTLDSDQTAIVEILAEARRLVAEQRRAFRAADFASFLATAVSIDALTVRLQRVQAEHLTDASRAGLVDLHQQIEQQRELLVMAVAASIPPMRTYNRSSAPKPKTSLLLDSFS